MSAKKYLKQVPPQQPAQPAAKTEKEEQLWNALKRHIMRERERKKQELEAEVEEERLRKEREAREKQDVMTLGETKEQIQMLERTLQDLRNEKQQLFLQLKKVLNEDDNRKRQMEKSVEMFAIHSIPQQQQMFLPQRPPTSMPSHQPHLIHKTTPPAPNVAKRTHSPSPQNYYPKPNTSQAYPPPQPQKSQYCPPGPLFYPANPAQAPPPDNRQPQPSPPQIIYPPYQGSLPMPIRQSYHVELPPQQGPPPQAPPPKAPELVKTVPVPGPPPGNVYHITLDHPGPPPQLKTMTPITIESDDRKDLRQPQQPPQQPPHLPEGIVYTTAMRPGPIPMHAIAANQQID